MKNLLNFTLLLSLSFLLINCSSNDDSDSKSKSFLVVGSWKPIKDVYVCSTGSDDVYAHSTCEQKSTLIINTNGDFSQLSFYEDFNNNCIADDDYALNETW